MLKSRAADILTRGQEMSQISQILSGIYESWEVEKVPGRIMSTSWPATWSLKRENIR
jgi:hypothetical protein